jgi:hypothetical protein
MITKRTAAVIIAVAIAAGTWILWPSTAAEQVDPTTAPAQTENTVASELEIYLTTKESPLAPDAKFLVTLKHWRLVVAISAIESQFCKRQLYNNCWGIGGDSAYRHYSSFKSAAQDANDLIEHWQEKGRWLTVEDMNCSYVQPCNENWVRTTNLILGELERIK